MDSSESLETSSPRFHLFSLNTAESHLHRCGSHPERAPSILGTGAPLLPGTRLGPDTPLAHSASGPGHGTARSGFNFAAVFQMPALPSLQPQAFSGRQARVCAHRPVSRGTRLPTLRAGLLPSVSMAQAPGLPLCVPFWKCKPTSGLKPGASVTLFVG